MQISKQSKAFLWENVHFYGLLCYLIDNDVILGNESSNALYINRYKRDAEPKRSTSIHFYKTNQVSK